MGNVITQDEELALTAMGKLLLVDRHALEPEEGDEAIRQHKMLAMAIHRASRLNRRSSDGEGEAQVRYFGEHFPPGRNDRKDADVLWEVWRTPLVKDGVPGLRVGITHGRAGAHWNGSTDLVINLEDMWGDFEVTVQNFVRFLRTAADRRQVALTRLKETSWTVQVSE